MESMIKESGEYNNSSNTINNNNLSQTSITTEMDVAEDHEDNPNDKTLLEGEKQRVNDGTNNGTDTNSVASESVTSTTQGKDKQSNDNDSESMDIINYGKHVDDDTTINNNNNTNKKEASSKSTSKTQTKKERKSSNTQSRLNHQEQPHALPIGTERTALQQNATTLQPSSTSFLDGLKEEDRRTRTRLLPAVDGFRKLHKSEIKQDLKLARVIALNAGKMSGNEEGGEDGDGKGLLTGPFIPPGYQKNQGDANTNTVSEVSEEQEVSSETEETNTTPKKQEQAPSEQSSTIETISAYNPPRPPESIGPKKKHRLLRWERHPHEIDIDLDNYKKTVDKTRSEWRKLTTECQNVEAMSGVLRCHFREHAKNLTRDGITLDQEYGHSVEKIRGVVSKDTGGSSLAGKDLVMCDFVDYLQTLGASTTASTFTNMSLSLPTNTTNRVSGIGGVTPASCYNQQPPASGWTLPGDKVQTPMGEGIVIDILPICELNPHNPPPAFDNCTTPSSNEFPPFSYSGILLPSRICIQLPFGIGYFTPEFVQVITKSCSFSDEELLQRWDYMYHSALKEGVHCDNHNSNVDNSSHYYHYVPKNAHLSPFIASDRILASDAAADAMVDQMETNNVVSASSSQIDMEEEQRTSEQELVVTAADHNDVSSLQQATRKEESYNTNSKKKDSSKKQKSRKRPAESSISNLPFNSNLLPCGSQRGTALIHVQPKDLELCLENQFRSCHGVIACPHNTEIPKNLLKEETQRLTLLSLQAQVLQRRNVLFRQKKIRLRNERCFENSIERSNKLERFMLEMKEDFVGLKGRLDKELDDLGINREKANCMLSDYYRLDAGRD